MTQQRELTTVARLIASPPEPIFDLLAEPRRHGEFDGSGSVERVKSSPVRVGLGDSFVMAMRSRGIRYSTTSTVVEYEENRRIAWQTYSTIGWLARFGGGRVWRYELEPAEEGTVVRETWDITHEAGRGKKGLGRDRVRNYMIAAMEKSLARIEEIVTARPPVEPR